MNRRQLLGLAAGGIFSPAVGVLESGRAYGNADSASLRIVAAGHPGGDGTLIPAGQGVKLTAVASDPYLRDTRYHVFFEPTFRWTCTEGRLDTIGERETVWTGPQAGWDGAVDCAYEATYRLRDSSAHPDAQRMVYVKLRATAPVVAAASSELLRDGFINGYEIGHYPSLDDPRYAVNAVTARQHPEAYRLPDSFYPVTRKNRDLRISEHYTLGDFAHDFPWGSLGLPQYIALDLGLVEKLEALHQRAAQKGLSRKKFQFIYGFRPPAYNLKVSQEEGVENLKAPFSMHQYGKAVDIVIDDDEDRIFDDLNQSGVSDLDDIRLLLACVDELDRDYLKDGDPRLGGAGIYSHHDFQARRQSPYLHIDTRGYAGSTGALIRWTIP